MINEGKFIEAEEIYRKKILKGPNKHISYWNNLSKEHGFNLKHTIVKGGKRRYDSVKNGLKFIKDEGIVAIHDGARPLLSKSLIKW